MKFHSILVLMLIIIIALAGCSGGGDGAATAGEEETNITEEPQEENTEEVEEDSPEEYDWTIKVSDTQTGTYSIPVGNKAIDFEMTLDLVAWKDDGTDVYGKYEGMANIIFDIDESKLTDTEVMMMGGAIFDRICEKMEFEVIPYDSEEYTKYLPSIPNRTTIAPLGEYNGMTNFISNWSTILYENHTAISQETGETLMTRKATTDDGKQDPMGMNMLIEGNRVTVSIPTYTIGWNVSYFYGDITRDSQDSRIREELEIPEKIIEEDDQNIQANTSPTTTEEDSSDEVFGQDSTEGQGQFIYNSDGTAGIDTNGDGQIDIHFNEDGDVSIDTDGDGIPDTTFEAEYSDGAGGGGE